MFEPVGDKIIVKSLAANEQTEEPEKIVVTGSRIKRDSFSIPTPLVTMDREAIADTGLTNLSDILVDNMPALSESIGNTTSQSSVSSAVDRQQRQSAMDTQIQQRHTSNS